MECGPNVLDSDCPLSSTTLTGAPMLDDRALDSLRTLLDSYKQAREIAAADPDPDNEQIAADLRLNIVTFMRRAGAVEVGLPSQEVLDVAEEAAGE